MLTLPEATTNNSGTVIEAIQRDGDWLITFQHPESTKEQRYLLLTEAAGDVTVNKDDNIVLPGYPGEVLGCYLNDVEIYKH